MAAISNTLLHRHTPTLVVIETRSLVARSVSYYRRDEMPNSETRCHIARFDSAGRTSSQWDARLLGSATPNTATAFSLSGQALHTRSVDSGWRVALHDSLGQPLQHWDSRRTRNDTLYDDCLRPVAIFETTPALGMRCVERLQYADTSQNPRNLCGGIRRHDDSAGTLRSEAFTVTGQPLRVTRQVLESLAPVDWPSATADCDALLRDGVFATQWGHNALGDEVEQVDAQHNSQFTELDIAGQTKTIGLVLQGGTPITTVSAFVYNALGQVESEMAGNGATTQTVYSAVDGRLQHSKTDDLQDMHYRFDPVGNIVAIEDRHASVQWFKQQKVVALSTYRYDTLYQLTEASGRENAANTAGPQLPDLVEFASANDSQWRNYQQTYSYDAGGNLTELQHRSGDLTLPTRLMRIAANSNRALLELGNALPDIDSAFDANGNLQYLQPGQTMNWDARNQLQRVAQVAREDTHDDDEMYVYDASGQRVRKVRTRQGGNVVHLEETLYLPGLEVRLKERQVRASASSPTKITVQEELHVVTASAGGQQVRLLHWHTGRPTDMENDQQRYSVSDQLGSSTLELDKDGALLSHESYYPFGGTAWWAAKNRLEGSYKFARYCGKERDATGLYYYGLRYYAPWLQRWINPDPAGNSDGLNGFCMVGNNPLSKFDRDGLAGEWVAMALGVVLVGLVYTAIGWGVGAYFDNAAHGATVGLLFGIATASRSAGFVKVRPRAAAKDRVETAAGKAARTASNEAIIDEAMLKITEDMKLNPRKAKEVRSFILNYRLNNPGKGLRLKSEVTPNGKEYAYLGPLDDFEKAKAIVSKHNNPAPELKRLGFDSMLIASSPLPAAVEVPVGTPNQFPVASVTKARANRAENRGAIEEHSYSKASTSGSTAISRNPQARTVNVDVLTAELNAGTLSEANYAVAMKAVAKFIDLRANAVNLHHNNKEWSIDLHGFDSSKGRGDWRLIMSHEGNNHFTVLRYSNHKGL